MQITVNGDLVEVADNLSIAALLARVGRAPEHVAVEHNGLIVDPNDFATLKLNPADRLEIVPGVGGG
jgi:thiamine biosynthesis protein ThiS